MKTAFGFSNFSADSVKFSFIFAAALRESDTQSLPVVGGIITAKNVINGEVP